jgi:2-keto-4-pentenoate hydratase
MEAEFAVRLEIAFPAQEKPYTRIDVEPHAALFLAIEIADSRFAQPTPPDTLKMIADNGGGAAWVLGPAIPNWRDIDFMTTPARLVVDGKVAGEALTGDGRIDPIDVALWAVNHLSQRGLGLATGAYLSTGTASKPVLMTGTECVADFGPLGDVRVTFLR